MESTFWLIDLYNSKCSNAEFITNNSSFSLPKSTKYVLHLSLLEKSDQGESLDRLQCSTGLISLFDQTQSGLASSAALGGVVNFYIPSHKYTVFIISKVDYVSASPYVSPCSGISTNTGYLSI